jgi:acetyl-CoA synthetase
VVGYPHAVKGQGIYAYVTLNAGEEYTDALRKELVPGCARRSGRSRAPT